MVFGIVEKGYDSGVLDVGDGYVVTVHIESHVVKKKRIHKTKVVGVFSDFHNE